MLGSDILRKELEWVVGYSHSAEEEPSRFVPATVPGAVQLDWAKAEGWPLWWQGSEHERYRWMEDVYWHYRSHLVQPRQLGQGERLVLYCGGVDYACIVRVGGRLVHQQEGMFSPFEIDLTDTPEGTLIEIVVLPAPKAPFPDGSTEGGTIYNWRWLARESCKPAVSYGWDFHPRLIPLGIWQDTYVEVRPPVQEWLDHAEVVYTLSEDFSKARLRLETQGLAQLVRWTLLSPSGETVAQVQGAPSELVVELVSPELWWPNTEGPAALYTSVVETLSQKNGAVTQTIRQRVGLRRIRLVHAPGQIDRAGMPATQPPEPMTFEVNGRTIFARGANWVCPEIFPGIVTADRTRELLDLFQKAHLNLIRCWGGAAVNKTAFFDQCDERGIMVWQEFPLACNNYPDKPEYLRVLDKESRAIIRRLKRHACVALWCGGNELFNSWSGMTSQSAAIRLLHRNCFELDPSRPWLPTSPIHGVRHGDYRFRAGSSAEAPTVFEIYRRLDATAYMEFGVPGPASAARLREVIPAEELWPPRAGGAWQQRHAFYAWHEGEPHSWLYPELAEDYFGKCDSLEQLVERLQLLQAIGYQAIYEEARRQKPTSSAVACWVFNEPWPTAANNSVVAWPAEPKMAYAAIALACRPTMVSARIEKFRFQRGENLKAKLFLLNDAPRRIDALEVRVRLERMDASEEVLLGVWQCPGAEVNRHTEGPEFCARIPDWPERLVVLAVDVPMHPEWSSRYKVALA